MLSASLNKTFLPLSLSLSLSNPPTTSSNVVKITSLYSAEVKHFLKRRYRNVGEQGINNLSQRNSSNVRRTERDIGLTKDWLTLAKFVADHLTLFGLIISARINKL